MEEKVPNQGNGKADTNPVALNEKPRWHWTARQTCVLGVGACGSAHSTCVCQLHPREGLKQWCPSDNEHTSPPNLVSKHHPPGQARRGRDSSQEELAASCGTRNSGRAESGCGLFRRTQEPTRRGSQWPNGNTLCNKNE